MTKALPLVSICMPTYNGEEFLAEALESAISQTYTNLEIVISDDASKDNTLEIVNTFIDKTEIPIIIYKNKNNGIGANWNNSVRHAKGLYIKFLFQDDILHKDCISKMMDMALHHPKVGLIYCKRVFIYNELTPKMKDFIAYYGNLHTHWHSLAITHGILSGKNYLKDKYLLNSPKNKIGEPPNVLLKRDCFATVGYFSEELEQVLDSDYWYRVMTRFDVGFVDEVLVRFRLHSQQASNINKKRELPDKKLIALRDYKFLFWHLHPKNKLKVLKIAHPIVRSLVQLKRKLYAK